MEKVYNVEILEAIHELDKKLVSQLGLITTCAKDISEVKGDLYDGEAGGIKFQNKTMWDKYQDKKGTSKEVKIIIIASIINGLITAGNFFNIV